MLRLFVVVVVVVVVAVVVVVVVVAVVVVAVVVAVVVVVVIVAVVVVAVVVAVVVVAVVVVAVVVVAVVVDVVVVVVNLREESGAVYHDGGGLKGRRGNLMDSPLIVHGDTSIHEFIPYLGHSLGLNRIDRRDVIGHV